MASFMLMVRRQIHMPRDDVGRRVDFADGTRARVYRETVVDRTAYDPCFLEVTFRLRRVTGRGHTLFRWESLLNTPLFVGFPGFVSKLWLAHDDRGAYRGLYEWDGPDRAERYARSLWRVLALVSEPESIDFRVFPQCRRDDALTTPDVVKGSIPSEGMLGEPAEGSPWWRVVGTG